MPRTSRALRRLGSLAGSTTISVSYLIGRGISAPTAAAAAASAATSPALGPNAAEQHVIYIQYDNTPLRRDLPNVPSDLEHMPNLLNFMRDNGSLLSNDHTILISHTGSDIL